MYAGIVAMLISTILGAEASPKRVVEITSATRAVEAFYAALKSNDCDAAFGMLTVEAQTRPQLLLGDVGPSERTNRHCVILASFLAGLAVNIDRPFIKAEVISSNTLPAGAASIIVRLSYEEKSGAAPQEATHYLVQECGTWKIMGKPSLP